MRIISWVVSAALLVLLGSGRVQPAANANVGPEKTRITVLYDAFGQTSGMQKDWGYAAFVEYDGKRILFDTGNNPDILAQNAKANESTSPNSISWLCRTAMGITWEDWATS